jgi:hypothetical protein
VAIWSLETVCSEELFSHHQVRSRQPKRKLTGVYIVIHIHKKDDFISSLFPQEKLFDEVLCESRMRREVTATILAKIPAMLRPHGKPATLVIASKATGRLNWSVCRYNPSLAFTSPNIEVNPPD